MLRQLLLPVVPFVEAGWVLVEILQKEEEVVLDKDGGIKEECKSSESPDGDKAEE